MATACPHLTYTTEAEPYVKENYQFKSNFCLFVTKALSCDQVMSQIIFLKFSHIWSGHVKTAGSAVVRLVGRQRFVVEHIQAALLWNNTSCLVDFLSSAILFPVTPMNSLCCDKLWSCFCRWARLLHGIFCRKNEIKKNRARHLALDIYRRDSQQLRLDIGFLWHFIVPPLCLCSFCWQLCILLAPSGALIAIPTY